MSEIISDELEITIGQEGVTSNYQYRFCYMVDARAKMGVNHETGEDCEIYAQITPGFEKEVPLEVQAQMHILYGEGLAEQFGFDPKYVHPISIEEYEANAD